MNIEFVATVAVIAPDPMDSRSCMSRRWVSRCTARVTAITTASRSPAASRSGSGHSPRLLKPASAPTDGLQSDPYRRSASSSMCPAPTPWFLLHWNSSRPDMICCTKPGRNHGVRQLRGFNHPRAR